MRFSKVMVVGIVVVLVAISMAAGAYFLLSDGAEEDSRSAISIGSDTGFTEANGVRSGSGTPEDPYIISDWVIRLSLDTQDVGVLIGDTSAHFVVRNVTVSGPLVDFETPHPLFEGIRMWGVSNGTIVSCSLMNFDVAVHLYDCEGVTVLGNRISSCRAAIESSYPSGHWDAVRDSLVDGNTIENALCGVFMRYPWNVTVSGNSFHGCRCCSYVNGALYSEFSDNVVGSCSETGLQFVDSRGCEILTNDVIRSNGTGLLIIGSSEMTVHGNEVWSGGTSLYIKDSDVLSVRDNVLRDVPYDARMNIGLHIQDSTNVTVVSNTVQSNDIGILLVASESSSMSVVLYHNSFFGNDVHAIDGCGSENQWDGGSEIGGNYWDVLGLEDEDKDGVADEPYWIDSDSVDRYPLIQYA